MSSIQLVERPIFFPGVALGEASEQGRIVDTMRESIGGRIYLHERIVHEGAACLGYSRPEEVAEMRAELERLRTENLSLQKKFEYWRPVIDAMVAITEERNVGRGGHRKKDPARQEMVEALTS